MFEMSGFRQVRCDLEQKIQVVLADSNAAVGAIGDAGRMSFERRLTESTCRSNRLDLIKGAVGSRPKADHRGYICFSADSVNCQRANIVHPPSFA